MLAQLSVKTPRGLDKTDGERGLAFSQLAARLEEVAEGLQHAYWHPSSSRQLGQLPAQFLVFGGQFGHSLP